MRDLGVQISRLDLAMVQKCYFHCLTTALEDLALRDL